MINPGQPIPRYIQAFTGINDEMVANAPKFEDVAENIYTILHDKIFIAHNVNFDYSFVKAHLNECGFDLNSQKTLHGKIEPQNFSRVFLLIVLVIYASPWV